MAEKYSNAAVSCLHILPQQTTPTAPLDDDIILSMARRILARRVKKSDDLMSDPNLVIEFLTHHLAQKEQEHFSCLFLDIKNRLIAFETLF